MQPLDPDKLPNPYKGQDYLGPIGPTESDRNPLDLVNRLGSFALVCAWLRVIRAFYWYQPYTSRYVRYYLYGTYFDNHRIWFLLLLPLLAMIWFPQSFARMKARSAAKHGRYQDPDKLRPQIRIGGWAGLVIFVAIVTATTRHDPPQTSFTPYVVPLAPATTNQTP
jgi:hypothetical protein